MKVEKAPNEFVVRWFCRLCWQRGVFTFQGDIPPDGYPEPANMPVVVKEHAKIWRGMIGGGRCEGELHMDGGPQIRRRARRTKPPRLPDVGEPVIVTKNS